MAHPDRDPCPYCNAGCLSVGEGRIVYACGAVCENGNWDRSDDCFRRIQQSQTQFVDELPSYALVTEYTLENCEAMRKFKEEHGDRAPSRISLPFFMPMETALKVIARVIS